MPSWPRSGDAMAAPSLPLPVLGTPALAPARARDLCTDCGVSRSSLADQCGKVCQFIHPRYEALERQVHGRTRDVSRPDEEFFGPFLTMHRARLVRPRAFGRRYITAIVIWMNLKTRIITTARAAIFLKRPRAGMCITRSRAKASRLF